jgi:hypothetical protein
MALNFSHGAIQWLSANAVGTIYTVSGLSFQPKALRFYWVGLQSNSPTNAASQAVNIRRGVGFAVSTTSRRSVGSFSQDNAGSSNCGAVVINTGCVVTVDGNGAVDGILDLNTITTDGFTLIVDDQGVANITVFWEAWGGDDITVAEVGDIAEPAATGTQNYTVTGFDSTGRNQVVMFAGCQSTAAVNTGQATDSGLHVGFSTSNTTANDITVCGNSDDNSGTSDTDGYCIRGECISMIVIAGGNPNARATLSAWGTNLFTLNWLARGTTNRRSIFLAIKGGSWVASSLTIAGNTINSTSTVSTLPFNPIGLSLIGRMTASQTAGSSTVQDRIGFGSSSVTTPSILSVYTENSAGVLDENNVGTTETDTIIQYNSVLSYPSAAGGVQTVYIVNSYAPNGFRLITVTAGGVTNEFIGYLVFGSQRVPREISVGHPFIT